LIPLVGAWEALTTDCFTDSDVPAWPGWTSGGLPLSLYALELLAVTSLPLLSLGLLLVPFPWPPFVSLKELFEALTVDGGAAGSFCLERGAAGVKGFGCKSGMPSHHS
jgi:hypothetical protein